MISVKFFELLFFAVISVVLINRLMSILGEIDEEEKNDPRFNKKRENGFFEEPGSVIDVTEYSASKDDKKKKLIALLSLFGGEDSETAKKMMKISEMLGGFNKEHFLQGANGAFQMIIESSLLGDKKTISELVDKRYIEDFYKISNSFCKIKYSGLNSNIADLNTFGNNVIIKVAFSAEKEEGGMFNQLWTFTKSALSQDNNWYLTNIDLSQAS